MSQAWCSVPCCTNSKRKSPHLSFHDFPVDESVRANWVKAIRRDEGPSFAISRGSTYVCSEHFNPEELLKSTQTNGRTRIKHGAVPSRFYWNDWGSQVRVPVSQRARKYLCASGLDDGAEMSDPGDSTENEGQLGTAKSMGDSSEDRVQQTIQTWQWTAVALDHDYVCHPSPGILDRASKRIRELELNVIFLETELEQMKVDVQQPLVYQYCVTDDDFRFYTRFISKEVFIVFWESIKPSDSKLVYWSKSQRTAQDLHTRSTCHKLPLIDEFFMFLCLVAAGLNERTLSSIFKVSHPTVSSIILTWTNYLFLVLGSLPLWMTREQVQSTLPSKFKLFCPEARVIIDCTEINCETPSSLSLQSETFPSYKNTTTFKGLIGISPCGLVTFVSKLYTGYISDTEITQRSQLLQLLEPGDGVMAGESFLIQNMLSEAGAKLIVPPLKKSAEVSTVCSLKTQAIARLLVERAIRRVKEYRIWNGLVPLSIAGSVNQLWSICCIMSNYTGPPDMKWE